MNMSSLRTWLRKDGWLLGAMLVCVLLSLLFAHGGSSDAPDEGISRVLSEIAGAGQVEVCVYYDDAVPCGALVVAQGAGDVAVQLRLTSAVSALLGIDKDRIAVYPRQGGR